MIQSKEITGSDFISLANEVVGYGLVQSAEENFKLAEWYAKQQAIAFMEWKENQNIESFDDMGEMKYFFTYDISHAEKSYTTDQLFTLFLNDIK